MPSQAFCAVAFDFETNECCTVFAGEFYDTCCSYNNYIVPIHYLLRKKTYRLMWCGNYLYQDYDFLKTVNNETLLLALSTAYGDDFDINNYDEEGREFIESCIDKYHFIRDNYNTWNRINVSAEALEYFDYKNTKTVKYDGFLVNHFKKQAINLKEYFDKSKYYKNGRLAVVDIIPVLTESGGGTACIQKHWLLADTTEDMACKWFGDMLQIVDECPNDYEIIQCCFAPCVEKATYCYINYGADEDGFVYKNENKELLRIFTINYFERIYRYKECYVKVTEIEGDNIHYSAVKVDEKDEC